MSYAEIPRGTAARGQEPSIADGMTPPERPRPPSSRRRDKPQLSCNACRSRNNCASRGLGSSCVYGGAAAAAQPDRPPRNAPVQDRINQLESLVLSLMQQASSTPSPHAWPPDTPSLSAPPADHTARSDAAPHPFERKAESEQLSDDGPEQIPRQVSPSPSDYGSIRIRKSGASYVSGAHWAAVLDSIAELRDHFEHDDEGYSIPADTARLPANFPSPQLLYGGCPLYATPASILESLPSRPVVDRLVSRYFNDLDMAPGVPHSGKFLREYEEFWGAPQSAPIVWVGLLFSMICLSSQFHQLFLASPNTLLTGGRSPQQPEFLEMQTTINLYREKIMQCLVLGHYTKGGPYVLETLILYFMVEVFLAKDTEVGIWVLVGNITQIAMHSGYHWDAKHFPNISPFAGEMRRRVWAVILQLDFTISSQLGLPRVIRESQTDTNEPRNLADSDFDEFTAELPPCRPETEATPILYTLAKLRLLHVGCKVADMATEPRPYSYAQIRDLDEQLNAARDALPSCLKWNGLASCIAVSPQVIIQRIWLEVTIQRQRIVLHKRFLVTSRLEPEHAFSRSTCLKAAMDILELQHLIDEETQIDGRLYQSRWRVSFSFIQDFLLATSTLCFYLQARDKGQKDQPEDTSQVTNDAPVDIDRIRRLLRTSQVIWLRESSASREARKAAAALDYVLGDSGVGSDSSGPPGMPSGPSPAPTSGPYFSGFPNLMPGVDFGGVDLGAPNDMPSWQRFAHNFTGDVESWAGANSSQYMNMDLES